MKIISNSFAYSPKYFTVDKKQENKISVVQNPIETKVPVETLKAYSFGSLKERRQNEYSSVENFSDYILDKVQKQMMVPDATQVDEIIVNVAKELDADKELVAKVLGRISQFASYSQLIEMKIALEDIGVSRFSVEDNEELNLNHVFGYLKRKKLFPLYNGNKVAFMTDFDNLHLIKNREKRKNNHNVSLNSAKKTMPFIVVDGWNATVDGKPIGYTMFGAKDTLENTTKAIVQEIQKTGKSIDEVLNGDIIAEIKKNYGDDAEIHILKNRNCKNYTPIEIARNLRDVMPYDSRIQSVLKMVSEKYKDKIYGLSEEELQKLLMVYTDSMFDFYSSHRLNFELKKKHKSLQNKVEKLGKTMDDVYYIVPNTSKSFSLVSYQYAKVNDVPLNRFINLTDKNYDKKQLVDLIKQDKVFVLLDDYAGSGVSITGTEFYYKEFLMRVPSFVENMDENQKTEAHLIFSPIVALENGKNYTNGLINAYGREDNDSFCANKVISFDKCMKDHLTEKEYEKMIKLIGSEGYLRGRSFFQFPFSLPDNNSDFANLFINLFASRYLRESRNYEFGHYLYEYMADKLGLSYVVE